MWPMEDENAFENSATARPSSLLIIAQVMALIPPLRSPSWPSSQHSRQAVLSSSPRWGCFRGNSLWKEHRMALGHTWPPSSKYTRVMFIMNFMLQPSLQNRGSSFFPCLTQGSGLLPRDGSQLCYIDVMRGDPWNQSRDCPRIQTRSKHSLPSKAIYLPHDPDHVCRLLIAANVENSYT